MVERSSSEFELRLFAGPLTVLRRFREVCKCTEILKVPGPLGLTVIPLDDGVHDALHRAYGTGDWLATGPRLSTGDLAFCGKASLAGPLAYLEAVVDGQHFHQAAAAWHQGVAVFRPQSLTLPLGESPQDGVTPPRGRQRPLWPLNQALQQLGIRATDDADAIERSGLSSFADTREMIAASHRLER